MASTENDVMTDVLNELGAEQRVKLSLRNGETMTGTATVQGELTLMRVDNAIISVRTAAIDAVTPVGAPVNARLLA